MFCPDLHQLRLNVPTCDQWRGRPGQLHPVTYHMAGWERKGALSDTLFGGTHGGLDQTHSIRRHWMRVAMTAPPARGHSGSLSGAKAAGNVIKRHWRSHILCLR